MFNKNGRGQSLDFVGGGGGHNCYEGRHIAHGGSPLGKALFIHVSLNK